VSPPQEALVAGAGVAGLSAAIALARAGWRVRVLERAPLLEEVGAGLQISPNAAAILRSWGVLERLSGRALAPEALRIRSAGDGRELLRMPLGAIAELRWGAPYLVVHRADLISALIEQAARQPALVIETGVEVVGFAPSQTSIQVATRRNGESERRDANLFVGADGLRSSVRERLGLGLADRPVWSGRTAWRALLEAGRAPPHAMRLETCLWLGPRAHLVHYPLRGGELINVVAITQDDWRGASDGDFWSASGEAAQLRPFFAHWHAEARELLHAVVEWRRWPLFDRNVADRWSDSRVVLVGDAAHPMLPFLAQGAAQSIEDAHALAHALSSHATIELALSAFERERIPRTSEIQLASRRQGTIYHLGGPAALVRDFAMRRLSVERTLRRLDWIYRSGA